MTFKQHIILKKIKERLNCFTDRLSISLSHCTIQSYLDRLHGSSSQRRNVGRRGNDLGGGNSQKARRSMPSSKLRNRCWRFGDFAEISSPLSASVIGWWELLFFAISHYLSYLRLSLAITAAAMMKFEYIGNTTLGPCVARPVRSAARAAMRRLGRT